MTTDDSLLSVSSSSNVLDRLRCATRAEHIAIEAALELTRADLTRAGYCRILERFWGFYQPVEARISALLDGGMSPLNFAPRRKLELLAADLQSLGVAAPELLPICLNLPELDSVAAAIGCLYVLEGSTLGGQVIARHIRKTIGVTPEVGGRFFHAYGDHVPFMWFAFKDALTLFATSASIQDQVVAAAISTFQALRRWCEEGANNDGR